MTRASSMAYQNASARRRAAVRVSSHKTRVSEMRDVAVRPSRRSVPGATTGTDALAAVRSGFSRPSRPRD